MHFRRAIQFIVFLGGYLFSFITLAATSLASLNETGADQSSKKALVVLSSADVIALSSPKTPSEISTGVFLVELAKFLEEFEKLGYSFEFATPDGKPPTIDINGLNLDFYHPGKKAPYYHLPFTNSDTRKARTRRMQEIHTAWKYLGPLKFSEPLPETDKEAIRFTREVLEKQSKLKAQTTLKVPKFSSFSQVVQKKRTDEFDMLYLPGGHAPMVDLINNPFLGEIFSEFQKRHKLVAAICHGPVALQSASFGVDANGNAFSRDENLFKGYKVTTVSKAEEIFVLTFKYPKVLNEKTRLEYFVNEYLEETGFDVRPTRILGMPKVIADRNLITANGPQAIDRFVDEIKNYVGSVEEEFKFGSIGVEENEGIPYKIWKILPEAFSDFLPNPDGAKDYSQFGFVYEDEKDQLPIGVSSKKVYGIKMVANNCAACHTTSYRETADSETKVALGGPASTVDLQGYLKFLLKVGESEKFNAKYLRPIFKFHFGVGPIKDPITKVLVSQTRSGLKDLAKRYRWMESRPLWGPGRIDPFNPVKFHTLELDSKRDETVGNSDMMPLWRLASRRDKPLHWDGLNSSLKEVIWAGAVGTGADHGSVPVLKLRRLQSWVERLSPPEFPFLDPAKEEHRKRGELVYQKNCSECHSESGARFGQVISLDEVETDRSRSEMWTFDSVIRYNGLYPKLLGKRANEKVFFKEFAKREGYVATRQDGLWLRGPYLHNGSVPTLRDLLNPPLLRPKKFYRGYNVIDTVNVGFISSGAAASEKGFLYDTTVKGNSNRGHLWGTELELHEKNDLIEYLKTF